MNAQELGERIRDLRKQKEWKQHHVAEILKISRSAYASYELGVRNMSLDIIMNLASLYNLSIDELVGQLQSADDGDMAPGATASPSTESEFDLRQLKAENEALKLELLEMYRKQSKLYAEIAQLRNKGI